MIEIDDDLYLKREFSGRAGLFCYHESHEAASRR